MMMIKISCFNVLSNYECILVQNQLDLEFLIQTYIYDMKTKLKSKYDVDGVLKWDSPIIVLVVVFGAKRKEGVREAITIKNCYLIVSFFPFWPAPTALVEGIKTIQMAMTMICCAAHPTTSFASWITCSACTIVLSCFHTKQTPSLFSPNNPFPSSKKTITITIFCRESR